MRDEKNIRRVIAPTAVCIAVVSFVSIELATSRYLISIFNSISGLISGTMPADYASFETNTRITSVMGNPNTFAPVAAIGMLLGVWLAGKARKPQALRRPVHGRGHSERNGVCSQLQYGYDLDAGSCAARPAFLCSQGRPEDAFLYHDLYNDLIRHRRRFCLCADEEGDFRTAGRACAA